MDFSVQWRDSDRYAHKYIKAIKGQRARRALHKRQSA
jgi:hypothetical protein